MPYKDPEKRRQFQKEYKRKWRKAQARINPLKGFKIYLCVRFPNLRVAPGYFTDGFLITNRPDIQAAVERDPEFGRNIFPLALDLNLV